MTARPVDANPYVGPRAIAYGESIYGRDHEIDDVTGTLVSQRIMLLYSPSGAGKSSLIDAGVRPRLEDRGFHVLPTIRVGHVSGSETNNRYAMSTKLSLSEAIPLEQRWDHDRLDAVSLDEQLDRVISLVGTPDRDPCLVFDQFEELFTLDSADWDEKRAFLTELGVALRRHDRWALFAMREDYIAQLDPLLSLIPTRLSARYRLDLLEPEAARLAVICPAVHADVEFANDAANQLIDDLRNTRVTRAGTTETVLGRYIEPVVLQAVCRRLWEQSGDQERIGIADVKALGDVDDALADFCDDRFAQAAIETGVPEHRIREWIEGELITEQGFRSQTASGPTNDGPAVLRALEDRHLLRAESRRGTTWYEIPHDRLVSPIRSSNRRWLDAHLDAVQTASRTWMDNDRPVDMLLRGTLLDNAERWIDEHPTEVLPVDQAFVEASRAEQQRIKDAKRRARRDRRLISLVSALGVVVVILGLVVAALVVALRGSPSEAEKAVDDAGAAAADSVRAGVDSAAAQAAEAEALIARARAQEEADAAARAQANAADDAEAEAALKEAETAAEAAQQALENAQAAAEEAAATEILAARSAEKSAAEAEALAISAAWDGEYVNEPEFSHLAVRLGHKGSRVGSLQEALVKRDLELEPDCFFGRDTEEAVKTVQIEFELPVTGIADSALLVELDVDIDPSTPCPGSESADNG